MEAGPGVVTVRYNSEPRHEGPISMWWCSSCERYCQILHAHGQCRDDEKEESNDAKTK